MSDRKEFVMTQDDYDELLAAMKPVPTMYLSGGQLMGGSQQENANEAWRKLGVKLGFQHMTVEPGRGKLFFTAVPTAALDELRKPVDEVRE